MDNAVRLARAVERARHEGVVLRCIAEDDELCCADALTVLRARRGFLDDGPHHLDGVHVDAALGGADVDAAADVVRAGQRLRDAADEPLVPGGKALVHQRRVAADEVDAHGLGRSVQRFGIPHRVCVRRAGQQHGDGRYRDALVYDGHAVGG